MEGEKTSDCKIRHYKVYLALALFLMLLQMWLASGTLSPYAASHLTPTVVKPCNYLVNLDHPVWKATFDFIDGKEPSTWNWSVVLRRMLYPLLAYPLMSLWGFLWGGFVTNLIIHAFTFLLFAAFIRRNFGDLPALMVSGLLMSYPGISYWAGLPYSYAMIVPCSLLSLTLLWSVYKYDSALWIILASLILGILSLGYDLLPYIGPALLLLLLLRRRFLLLPLAALMLIIPVVSVLWILSHFYGVKLVDDNSGIYLTIINSYLSLPAFDIWWPVIKALPHMFWHNYLYSNFLVLPLFFIILIIVGRFYLKLKLHPVEWTFALAILLVFIFNNAAPPYASKWQIRSEFIPRVYQPVFVVFLLYTARVFQLLEDKRIKLFKKSFISLVVMVILLQFAIATGPLTGFRLSNYLYYNFYRHSVPDAIDKNVAKYGKRPLGFCK